MKDFLYNLKNKVVLITGGSSGIGQATAIRFGEEGAKIVFTFNSNHSGATETEKTLQKLGVEYLSVKSNLTQESQLDHLFLEIKNKFNNIDVLINNAGIFDESDGPTNIEAFENIYRNNFLSHVSVTKRALELMKQGKIINISSVHGKLGHGSSRAIAYSAFKAALESYTKNLAKQLAPDILVNAVAPGRVVTPQWGNLDVKEQKELGKVHLIQRMIQPIEVANSIIFLAKNNAICGEILTVDGGMTLVTLG